MPRQCVVNALLQALQMQEGGLHIQIKVDRILLPCLPLSHAEHQVNIDKSQSRKRFTACGCYDCTWALRSIAEHLFCSDHCWRI